MDNWQNGNESKNKNNFIVIDKRCLVKIRNNTLKIEYRESIFGFLFLLSFGIYLFIMFLLIIPLSFRHFSELKFQELKDFIILFTDIVLIILSSLFLPCIIGSISYKNRSMELKINRKNNSIKCQKKLHNFKGILAINFSEVEYIFYYNATTNAKFGIVYAVKFFLKNRIDFEIFEGSKQNCEKLGKLISKFMSKLFIFKEERPHYFKSYKIFSRKKVRKIKIG